MNKFKFIILLIISVFLAGCKPPEGNKESYFISFETFSESIINTKIVYENEVIDSLSSPEKKGYQFLYWTYDEEFTQRVTFPFTVTSSCTLYAYYEPIEYSVTIDYNPQIGTINGFEKNTYYYEETLNIQAIPNEGYLFKGWYENNVLISFDNHLQFNVKEDVDLEAHFIVDEYNGFIPINNKVELDAIRSNLDGSYIITDDIDLYDVSWEPIGTEERPFTGQVNGNGCNIWHLSVNNHLYYNVGLFGKIKNAHLYNINLVDLDISLQLTQNQSYRNIGGLVGYSSASIIENVTVEGDMNIDTNFITIPNSLITTQIGGIVGFNEGTLYLVKSFLDIEVQLLNQSTIYVGGLVGLNSDVLNNNVLIINSMTDSTIKAFNNGNRLSSLYVGGLVGCCNYTSTSNTQENRNSFKSGIINSYSAGYMYIEGCYITSGSISGSHTKSVNVYSDMNVNVKTKINKTYGQNYFGGLFGYINGYTFNSFFTGDFNITFSYADDLINLFSPTVYEFDLTQKYMNTIIVYEEADHLHNHNDTDLYSISNFTTIPKVTYLQNDNNELFKSFGFKEYIDDDYLLVNPFAVWIYNGKHPRFYWDVNNESTHNLTSYIEKIKQFGIDTYDINDVDNVKDIGLYEDNYLGLKALNYYLTDDHRSIFDIYYTYLFNTESKSYSREAKITIDITDRLGLNHDEEIIQIEEQYILTSTGRLFKWDILPPEELIFPNIYLPLIIEEITANFNLMNNEKINYIYINGLRTFLKTNQNTVLCCSYPADEFILLDQYLPVDFKEDIKTIYLFSDGVIYQTNDDKYYAIGLSYYEPVSIYFNQINIDGNIIAVDNFIVTDSKKVYNITIDTSVYVNKYFENYFSSFYVENFIQVSGEYILTDKGNIIVRGLRGPELVDVNQVDGIVTQIGNSNGYLLAKTSKHKYYYYDFEEWVEINFSQLCLVNLNQ